MTRDGRVVGSYLAEVTARAQGRVTSPAGSSPARTIYLVDGDAEDAEQLREALRVQGAEVVTVHREDVDAAIASVRAALETGA